MSDTLLDVRDLHVSFSTDRGELTAVDNVSFSLRSGQTVCLVGESGCGKSVTSLTLMGLLASNATVSGSIDFAGTDLALLSEDQMRSVRGNDIAMVFQEPMTSLNPVLTIGDQLSEGPRLHLGLSKRAARELALDMLIRVGIPRPEAVLDDYPHLLSGGMRQRVMIAMALSCVPRLLIADEPTTALDVTIQSQILELIKDLGRDSDTAVILITHDLGVVAEMADWVVMMYAGQVVEETDVMTLFERPLHPYTRGLMASIPRLESPPSERLESIPGVVPGLADMPTGCRFHTRCPFATDICRAQQPALVEVAEGHRARCFHIDSIAALKDGEGAVSQ